MATSPFAVIAPYVRGAIIATLATAVPFAIGAALFDHQIAALMGFGGFVMILVDETGTLRSRTRAHVLGVIGVTGGAGLGILLDAPWPVVAAAALVVSMVASRALLLPGPGRILALFPLLGFAVGVSLVGTFGVVSTVTAILVGTAIGAAFGLVRAPLIGALPIGGALTADLAATAVMFEAVGADANTWQRSRATANRAASTALEAAEASAMEAPQLAATGRLRACAASLRLHDGQDGVATGRQIGRTVRALADDPSALLPDLPSTPSAEAATRGLDELVGDLRRGPRSVPPARLIRPSLDVLLRAPWRRSLAARHGLRLGLGLALLVAIWNGAELPFLAWALLTATLVAAPRMGQTVQRGRDRALGTMVGVVVAIAILPAVGSTTAVIIAIGLAALAVHVVRPRGYAYLVAPATVAALLLVQYADPRAADLAGLLDRVIAAIAGIMIALVLNRVWLPEWSPHQLHDAVATALDALADRTEGAGDVTTVVALADVAEACAARDNEPADLQVNVAWGDDALAALRRTADAISAARSFQVPIAEAAQELRALASWLRGELEIAPVARASVVGPDLLDAELAALRVAVEQGARSAIR